MTAPSATSSPVWLQLQHPLVRDLAWCVFSPPLIGGSSAGQRRGRLQPDADEIDWLRQLDARPEPLQQWLQAGSMRRLGLRFERLWQFWLQQGPATRHWQHRFNLQIRDAGRTLGELDAVSFNSASSELCHRELAVKFYLGVASAQLPAEIRAAAPFSWVGANVSDRLDIKMTQLLQRQMHLLDKPQAQRALPDDWHWQRLRRHPIVRGRLFYPLQALPEGSPDDGLALNPEHLRGTWLHCSEFTHLRADYRWLPLTREAWFSGPAPAGGQTPLDSDAMSDWLQHHFARSERALQVAQVAAAGDSWRELQRYYVVSDTWPRATRPPRSR